MLPEIQETINPNIVLPICDATRTLLVKESASSSKIKTLKIKHVPVKSIAFTLDYQPRRDRKFFKQLSCYVNPTCGSGVNKSCDLVVVTDLGENNYDVLVLDIKSDKPSKSETEKQLLNSELFIKYLVDMIQNHCKIDVNKINYLRTIVTTDMKSLRKNPIHGKTERRKIRDTSYGITAIQVNKRKECTVNYGSLCC